MIRLLFLAFLLSASPVLAGSYETLVRCLPGIFLYVPFTSGPNDVIGPSTGTCSGSGSCSYGNDLTSWIKSTVIDHDTIINMLYEPPGGHHPETDNISVVSWSAGGDTGGFTVVSSAWERAGWQPHFVLQWDGATLPGNCGTGHVEVNSSQPYPGLLGYICDNHDITSGVHMVSFTCSSGGAACALQVDDNSPSYGSLNYGDPGTGATAIVFPSGQSGAFAMYDGGLTNSQLSSLYLCGTTGFGCSCFAENSHTIGQIIGLRDIAPRLPAALRGAYRRIEPAAFIPNGEKIN